MDARISRMPETARTKRDDNSRFLRIQALVRARYSDPAPASQAFARQMQGETRCMALMGMGILASRQNRINDATRHFDEALACSPNDQLIMREAGRFHYTKGDRNRGDDLLHRAVSLNPNDTLGLYYKARSLGDSGRTTEALGSAQQLLRKIPEDYDVHELMARLYAGNRQMFLANLHMAYGALYNNDKRKTEQFMTQAEKLVKTAEEKRAFEKFNELYDERKTFWK
jgi:predicted Zn-dependent protease